MMDKIRTIKLAAAYLVQGRHTLRGSYQKARHIVVNGYRDPGARLYVCDRCGAFEGGCWHSLLPEYAVIDESLYYSEPFILWGVELFVVLVALAVYAFC